MRCSNVAAIGFAQVLARVKPADEVNQPLVLVCLLKIGLIEPVGLTILSWTWRTTLKRLPTSIDRENVKGKWLVAIKELE